MKKISILAFAMCLFAAVNAQSSVQNGGFETWSSGGLFSQEQPQDWTAALVGTITQEIYGIQIPIPVDTYFGSKTTESHGGSYALKLQANNVGIPGTDYTFLMPGIAQYGHAEGFSIPLSTILDLVNMISNQDTTGLGDLDWESLASLSQIISPGMPCTETPAHVNLWVKYQPQGDDSLMVIAFTKNGGSVASFAQLSAGGTMDEYTQLSATFDAPLAPCDSLCIIIVSGSFSTDENTVLYVDDVCIDYELGVQEMDMPKLSVYPNPTVESFTISLDSEEAYDYQLMDVAGKVVANASGVQGTATVDVREFTPGMYLLRVNQHNQYVTRKVVVR